jgi:hypothetical protein
LRLTFSSNRRFAGVKLLMVTVPFLIAIPWIHIAQSRPFSIGAGVGMLLCVIGVLMAIELLRGR